MKTTKSRLLEFLDHLRLGQNAFEKKVGISNGYISHNKGSVGSEIINKIAAAYPELNIVWLQTGEGDMLKSSGYPYNDNRSDIVRDGNSPYNALLGQGKGVAREPGEIPLIPYEIVEKIGLDNYLAAIERGYEKYVVPEFSNADFLTRMAGNTMYPKYSSGDVIACKYLPLDTFYQWNKIYAFNTKQGLLIKRVHEGKDESHLMLSSDNDRYPAFQISKNHITAQALVLGSIRLD